MNTEQKTLITFRGDHIHQSKKTLHKLEDLLPERKMDAIHFLENLTTKMTNAASIHPPRYWNTQVIGKLPGFDKTNNEIERFHSQ